jgi:PAP2 superfamily
MPACVALAAAVLVLRTILFPLPAATQTRFVPSAVEPAKQSSHLVSRRVMAFAGLLFAGALMGDQEFQEETQEGRDGLTNREHQLRLPPISGASSFPSGHTTVAFALATAVADQTHDGWSDYVLYGAATLTALSRINDNNHWASDVLVGGVVGYLSARCVTRRMGPLQVTPAGLSVYIRF